MGRARPCSTCHVPHSGPHRYCRPCFAAYMREWRKSHPLTPEQKRKDTCRSYAGVYKRRGKLVPQSCRCGSRTAQMHHPDYSKPLKVEWLCRPCHLAEHAAERRAVALAA